MNAYNILKIWWLTSTATGYDIITKQEHPRTDRWGRDDTISLIRKYRNVSASTMRRFYALSNSRIEIVVEKKINDFMRLMRILKAGER